MRRRLAWALVALLVGAATLAAIAKLRDDRGVKGPVLQTDLIAVRADVLPHEHLFGDRLTARVDVLLDRAFVKPESIQVVQNFAPFRVDGNVRPERRDLGDTTHLRYLYPLDCLRGGLCLPEEEGRRYELPEVRVSYVVTEIGERQTTRVALPILSGSSRLLAASLNAPAFRADPREVPPPTYRVSPTLLAVGARASPGCSSSRARCCSSRSSRSASCSGGSPPGVPGGAPTSSARWRTCVRPRPRATAARSGPRSSGSRASSAGSRATSWPSSRGGSPGRSRRPWRTRSAGSRTTSTA